MDADLKRVMVLVIFSIVVTCHGQMVEEIDNSLYLDELENEEIFMDTSLPEGKTEKAAQMIEELSQTAEQSSKTSTAEVTNIYYDSMSRVLDDIIYAVKDRAHAYQFLKAKGLHRVIWANLNVDHVEMKTKLLVLMKGLFEVAPVTTNALIPKKIVTKLLDIFEESPNLALKAHSLDVLYKWLPNNPDIQMRVMRIKGLEPFYSQIDKLDISVIQTLLKLFNTILKEHVKVRSGKDQVSKMDHDRKIMYQRIGLLERMETSNVCNGLVNIFQVVWAYNNNGEVVKIVLELAENMKPFCADILRGKPKAMNLFKNLLTFVQNDDKKAFLEDIGIDAEKIAAVLEDFGEKLTTDRIDKDEF